MPAERWPGSVRRCPARSAGPFAPADCDDVAFAPDGDLYFACHSPQDNLPVAVRGSKPAADEMDAYVLRVRPRNGELVFATRLGGSSFDAALRIAVDRQGFIYTTGLTKSKDFPITPDAGGRCLHGSSDAFLARISPTGEILYSTLIGGMGDELGNALKSTDDDAFLCRIDTMKHQSACVTNPATSEARRVGLARECLHPASISLCQFGRECARAER